MKKKIISTLLCVSMTAAMMTGCSGGTKDTAGEPASTETTESAADSTTAETATADAGTTELTKD